MVVAGGSVDATVGRAVEAGVVVKVAVRMDGTVAAADVLSAGIVTTSGRGVLVSNACATTVGRDAGVSDGVVVGEAVDVNDGVMVGVADGVLVLVGIGVKVLEAVAVAVGCGVFVVSVGSTAAAVDM